MDLANAFCFFFFFFFLHAPRSRSGTSILKGRWSLYLSRGVLRITMITTFPYGVQLLSPTEAYSIFFIAPMLIMPLSVFI